MEMSKWTPFTVSKAIRQRRRKKIKGSKKRKKKRKREVGGADEFI